MATTTEVRIVSVSIERPAHDTYEYLADPESLPKWATTFCKAIRNDGEKWIVKTSHGEVVVRFVERNALGVLDHYVTTERGIEIYVPMRVVPNDSGSEVMLIVFHPRGAAIEEFEDAIRMVKADLATLKKEMEKDASQ